MLFRTATVPAQGAGSALRGSEGPIMQHCNVMGHSCVTLQAILFQNTMATSVSRQLHFFKLRFKTTNCIQLQWLKKNIPVESYGMLWVHGRHPWKWHIKSSHSSD